MPPRTKSTIVLIGCGKAKAIRPETARTLYIGSLFRKRLAYAESTGNEFYILSAKYGLAHPDQVVHPYDLTISDLAEIDQAAWFVAVLSELLTALPDDTKLADVTIEIHAGEDYAGRLERLAVESGIQVIRPLQGLSQGEQMAWYSQHTSQPVV